MQLESSAQVSFARDAYAFGQLAESLLPHLAEFGMFYLYDNCNIQNIVYKSLQLGKQIVVNRWKNIFYICNE